MQIFKVSSLYKFYTQYHMATLKALLQVAGGRVVRFLLQLSERWPCHIWLVGRMKFASLEANLGWGQGL